MTTVDARQIITLIKLLSCQHINLISQIAGHPILIYPLVLLVRFIISLPLRE